MTVNRIDPTPLRISNNVTIQRQTPKTDFGDRMKNGLDTAAGVVANGAAVVGGIIPGGAIVSAAVSSVSSMGGNVRPMSGGGSMGTGTTIGGSGGAVSSSYGATGVVTLGGGASSGGMTLGTTNTVASSGTGTNSIPSSGSSTLGDMNQQLIQSQSENAEMMNLQNQMQHENIVFTSVSNVLKTRHDTAKNSIGNVR
jgi:hypothetical protein